MEENLSECFSKLSHSLTEKIPKNIKKENGIFFTPLDTVKTIYLFIISIGIQIKSILEPSCGSCQFIEFLNSKYDGITICGIEYSRSIFEEITKINFGDRNKVLLINEDFLKYKNEMKYDLIIGNPPYFVISKKDINKIYYKYIDGRPNIYTIFIIHSFEMLNDNGILAFVLPKSFLNCLYYDKLRRYINDNLKILTIIDHGKSNYIDTDQETCSIIIQNIKDISNNSNYSMMFQNKTIFSYNIEKLKELTYKSTTLDSMGFQVSVGTVVWNQVKDLLTDDITKCRLIYSSDIVDNKLSLKKYGNQYKKNFINKKGINDLMLIVNRGYGKGKYKFNYCLLDTKEEYLVENHLICIKYKETIEKQKLIKLYDDIIKSFNTEKTENFIEYYFENNAINTNELQNILPIFLD